MVVRSLAVDVAILNGGDVGAGVLLGNFCVCVYKLLTCSGLIGDGSTLYRVFCALS